MINPGSSRNKNANSKAIDDANLLTELNKFDDDYHQAEWFEFSADQTMHCVKRLFCEYEDYRGKELSGVVQIFNLFYLREANLGLAQAKAVTLDEELLPCCFTNNEEMVE